MEGSVEYHKGILEKAQSWAKRGLPFFWDKCEDARDGSIWICIPPHDDNKITLCSEHIFTNKQERIVSVEEFITNYKIINNQFSV